MSSSYADATSYGPIVSRDGSSPMKRAAVEASAVDIEKIYEIIFKEINNNFDSIDPHELYKILTVLIQRNNVNMMGFIEYIKTKNKPSINTLIKEIVHRNRNIKTKKALGGGSRSKQTKGRRIRVKKFTKGRKNRTVKRKTKKIYRKKYKTKRNM